MNARIKTFLREMEEFKNSGPGVALELRLSLAELIIKHLGIRGWNQKLLADKAGVAESFISRLLHSDANFTSETAGNLLFALGLRAKVVEHQSDVVANTYDRPKLRLVGQETTNGQETEFTQEFFAGTAGADRQVFALAAAAEGLA